MTLRLPNILIRNLGCKVNLSDAATIVDRLPLDRCRLVNSLHEADVVMLNTCTVTHKADRDVRKILSSMQRDHPNVSVVVTGCGVMNDHFDFSRYSNIRSIIPPGNSQEIATAVLNLGDRIPLSLPQATNPQTSSFLRIGRHRAFVKVQDGCNSGCAYCIVPRTRGSERSLEVGEVVNQVRKLIDLDHREIVLTGVHLGRYGTDLHPPASLAGLLGSLSSVFERLGSGFRLRMSSIEPLEWTQALFEMVCASKFVCNHYHIPLQSGDDSVLRNMRRPYQVAHFQDVVTRLHDQFPDASFGTDILVGFPGESERAAENTYHVLRSLPLSYLHVFTYSPRPDTLASKMRGHVNRAIVEERALKLRRLGQRFLRNFLQQGLGQPHSVLIEKQNASGLFGRSGNYRSFRLASCVGKPGQLVEVIAKKVYKNYLVGEPWKRV